MTVPNSRGRIVRIARIATNRPTFAAGVCSTFRRTRSRVRPPSRFHNAFAAAATTNTISPPSHVSPAPRS